MPKPTLTVIVDVERAPYAHLPRRHREFIEHVVHTGDPHEAYLAVGYKDDRNSKTKARALRMKLHSYVEEAMTARMQSVDMCAMAYANIVDLAKSASSEAIKLQAAKEILSRGGFDTPKEVTINHNHRNLTNEQIDARIKEIREELASTLPPPIEGEAELVEDAELVDETVS